MGVLVAAAYEHRGVARELVHRLKYEGSAPAAGLLARAMAPLLPSAASALVPVPRVLARRWRYGVDPALELALALQRLVGVPVVRALRPVIWTPRRAGPSRADRGLPRFTLVRAAAPRSVLVDDVATTGTTLAAAGGATGIGTAVTATSALRP